MSVGFLMNTSQISNSMKMEVKIPTAAEQAQAAPINALTDDLLIEILLRLPVQSLVRFKLISKDWLDLITSPEFCHLCYPNPNSAVGLFCTGYGGRFQYVPFYTNKATNPPLGMLHFLKDSSDIRILNSCNGLLLCCRSWVQQPYYVYNPTTNHRFKLPRLHERPEFSNTKRLSLAFNPIKSHSYKVVCIRFATIRYGRQFQIEVYCSEEGSWKVRGEPFTASVNFDNGVYWNGGIHWIGLLEAEHWYFNIDRLQLKKMPRPPILKPCSITTYYFGESCDHLHFIAIYGLEIQFDVFEMKRDHSEWFVKYQINLSAVVDSNPSMIRRFMRSSFYVYTVVRGGGEEDEFLVLRIPGKATRYNLVDMTFEMVLGFGDVEDDIDSKEGEVECAWRIHSATGYQYIESLHYV